MNHYIKKEQKEERLNWLTAVVLSEITYTSRGYSLKIIADVTSRRDLVGAALI